MKYKSGEEPQVGDTIQWESNGWGSGRSYKGEVVKIVPKGESILALWPEWIAKDVKDGRVRDLEKNILPIGKMDRLLVVVTQAGPSKPEIVSKPFLKAPLPGSLKLVSRR